jgi:uncharacterized protein YgbK (DUF1537 family)
VTAGDLDAIAAMLGPGDIAVGAAGLARALAERWGASCTPGPPPAPPVTFVIGSPHWVSRQQVDWLRASAHRGYTLIELGADLTEIAQAVLASPATLFLSGGDTALAVCRFLGARAIQLERELLPGVPQGRLIGGSLDGRAVITKSGGFGTPDTLGCILDLVSGDNRVSS